MSQLANGTLYVEYFTPTENLGEYVFENGYFNTQTDPSGSGAYGLNDTFVLFVPLTDAATATPLLAAYNRFKITNLTIHDANLISGTILYDEEGPEIGLPSSGVFCLVASTSVNHKLAAPPIDSIYTDLIAGGTISAMLNDLINRVDKIGGTGTGAPALPIQLPIVSIGQTVFNLNTTVQSPESSMLFVNGVYYSHGASKDYVISGQTLTWTSSFELDPSDSMVLRT